MPATVPPGSVFVALPHVSKQGFTGATVSSLVYAIIGGGFGGCGFHFLGDYSVVHARNAAAQAAIQMGYEWLLFIDSDMDFPVQLLAKLKECDSDIACADMWSRNVPSFRTVMRYTKKKHKGQKMMFEPVKNGAGIMDVDCCGMACTLIRVSLLRKFAKKKLAPFSMSLHGEDAYFCIVARQKFGATIRCNFDVATGHWGVCRVAGQDWSRDARNGFGALADPEYMKRMGILGLEEHRETARDTAPAAEPKGNGSDWRSRTRRTGLIGAAKRLLLAEPGTELP